MTKEPDPLMAATVSGALAGTIDTLNQHNATDQQIIESLYRWERNCVGLVGPEFLDYVRKGMLAERNRWGVPAEFLARVERLYATVSD